MKIGQRRIINKAFWRDRALIYHLWVLCDNRRLQSHNYQNVVCLDRTHSLILSEFEWCGLPRLYRNSWLVTKFSQTCGSYFIEAAAKCFHVYYKIESNLKIYMKIIFLANENFDFFYFFASLKSINFYYLFLKVSTWKHSFQEFKKNKKRQHSYKMCFLNPFVANSDLLQPIFPKNTTLHFREHPFDILGLRAVQRAFVMFV